MKNLKNKRPIILVVILIGLLVIGYKVIFTSPSADFLAEESTEISTAKKVEIVLDEVEKINFDTKVMSDPKFISLKSIETILPSLPVGKRNPFSP